MNQPMNTEEFQAHVHNECIQILRALAQKRYDRASVRVAALCLLTGEQRGEYRSSPECDPYDLQLLGAMFPEESEPGE